MPIQEIQRENLESALTLAWNVFLEFEAPDYSADGIAEFQKSIHDPEYLKLLRIIGAFENKQLIGVIATRNSGSHIALFFVDGKHQRKGIGRALFDCILSDVPNKTLTVNSSPFAVPIYRRLGFVDTDTEHITNGLRYTPMEYHIPVLDTICRP